MRLTSKYRNRRGFTVVVMVFMLTVLIGAAGFAVDFGQMYRLRAQLHAGADAGALAGAERLMRNSGATSEATAIAYATKNPVGPGLIASDDVTVVFGKWDPADSPPFTQRADYTVSDVNAVRVTAKYRGSYTFGGIFGFGDRVLTASSDAAVGGIGTTTCIRPVAIPYSALLTQLGHDPTDVAYNLTPADVVTLQGAHTPVQLKLGSDATSGNFYLLQLGPYANSAGTPYSPSPNWGGDNIFVDRFGGSASCAFSIGPGDWLQGKQGNVNQPTENGFELLCSVTVPNGQGFVACSTPKTIKVAMWATEDDGMCSPRCFQVKYTGAFTVTGYTVDNGKNAQDGLWGYFTDLATDGAFTIRPSPLLRIALVR